MYLHQWMHENSVDNKKMPERDCLVLFTSFVDAVLMASLFEGNNEKQFKVLQCDVTASAMRTNLDKENI